MLSWPRKRSLLSHQAPVNAGFAPLLLREIQSTVRINARSADVKETQGLAGRFHPVQTPQQPKSSCDCQNRDDRAAQGPRLADAFTRRVRTVRLRRAVGALIRSAPAQDRD